MNSRRGQREHREITIPHHPPCTEAAANLHTFENRYKGDIGGVNRLMKAINQGVITCLIITVCACVAFLQRPSVGSSVAVQTTEPQVKWFDDFLGINLHPGYAVSLGGSGSVKMSSLPSIGGVVALSTSSSESGVARLRFGEDPATGAFDVRNFSAAKNMTYKARVFLNTNTNLQATVGLIGLNDPEHVIAAIYNAEPGNTSANWAFEVINGKNRMATTTQFQHAPDIWFTVKIVTEWGDTPSARIYINDEIAPLAMVTGDYVPSTGLCPEFQIWNKQAASGLSQASLYVDYLSVTQDR
jgi:hypothetical protein